MVLFEGRAGRACDQRERGKEEVVFWVSRARQEHWSVSVRARCTGY
jgi:hypothetical protein